MKRGYYLSMIVGYIRKILYFLTYKNVTPPRVLKVISIPYDFIFRGFKTNKEIFSLTRFYSSNRVLFIKHESRQIDPRPFDILFVSTYKDFVVLPHAIKSVLAITSNYVNLNITIITPDKYVKMLEQLLQEFEVTVQQESLYLDDKIIIQLKKSFGNRFGWILQQLLKLKFVLQSESAGVLIIDSDTLLLEPREWLKKDGSQLLTPTWEYHRPYYRFLVSIGIGDLNPEYTFVSHHMVMQPKILKELFDRMGWKEVGHLVNLICKAEKNGDQSPFSLDYELYAQYLYHNYPEKVHLGKWSNKAIPMKNSDASPESEIEYAVIEYSGKLASLSFHSYL